MTPGAWVLLIGAALFAGSVTVAWFADRLAAMDCCPHDEAETPPDHGECAPGCQCIASLDMILWELEQPASGLLDGDQ